MESIGIIGVGNPLRRDDGIGIILLNKIQEKKDKFQSYVDFIDGGTSGFSLIHIIERYNVVVFIDAINFNVKPGEFIFFNTDEVSSKKTNYNKNMHSLDLLKLINFSKNINDSQKRIFVFGVQPKDVSFGRELSKELKDVFDSLLLNLTENIMKLIDDNKLKKR